MQKWIRNYDSLVEPLLKKLDGMQHFAAHDLPKAVSSLAQADLRNRRPRPKVLLLLRRLELLLLPGEAEQVRLEVAEERGRGSLPAAATPPAAPICQL